MTDPRPEPVARRCGHPGCEAYACYGMGVALRKGIEGIWFCAPHTPPGFWTVYAAAFEAGMASAPPAPPCQGQLL